MYVVGCKNRGRNGISPSGFAAGCCRCKAAIAEKRRVEGRVEVRARRMTRKGRVNGAAIVDGIRAGRQRRKGSC